MYSTGLIQPFWGTKHKELDYQRIPFNDGIQIQTWKLQGYSQKEFTGKLYDMSREMPDWTSKFMKLFDGVNITLSFYKMNTCNILPHHSDTYKKYRELYNIDDPSVIKRAIIFLEDRRPGHIFEIDGKILDWTAGTYVLWNHDCLHMAANLGLEPRYTAQITFCEYK